MQLRTGLIADTVAVTQVVGIAPDVLGGTGSALLEFSDSGLDSRVVVLCPGALEVACAMLRLGHAEVTVARLSDHARCATADVVIVPQVSSAANLAKVVSCARRMLAPLGTVAMEFAAEMPSDAAHQARNLLRLHGFAAIRFSARHGATLIRAELPLMGALRCA